MTKRSKTIAGIAAIVVIAAIISVAQVSDLLSPNEVVFEVDGTITYIDLAAMEATWEGINPRNGNLVEITAPVPPECEVYLNGKPAKMEAIRAGDRAKIKARWNRTTKRAIPLSVRVERPVPAPGGAVTASQPAGGAAAH